MKWNFLHCLSFALIFWLSYVKELDMYAVQSTNRIFSVCAARLSVFLISTFYLNMSAELNFKNLRGSIIHWKNWKSSTFDRPVKQLQRKFLKIFIALFTSSSNATGFLSVTLSSNTTRLFFSIFAFYQSREKTFRSFGLPNSSANLRSFFFGVIVAVGHFGVFIVVLNLACFNVDKAIATAIEFNKCFVTIMLSTTKTLLRIKWGLNKLLLLREQRGSIMCCEVEMVAFFQLYV